MRFLEAKKGIYADLSSVLVANLVNIARLYQEGKIDGFGAICTHEELDDVWKKIAYEDAIAKYLGIE